VSRWFCHVVRSSQQFQDSAVLVLTENTKEEILNRIKTSEMHSWRAMKIDVTVPVEVLHEIRPILEQIEVLSLTINFIWDFELPGLEEFTKTLLTSTPKLTYVKMDVRLMHRNLVDVFSCPAVQTNLAKLKILEILTWDYETNNFLSANNRSVVSDDSIRDAGDDEETFTVNMKMLTTAALQLSRLEGLHLTNDPCSSRLSFWKPVPVSKLLQNHRESLESLSVHLGSYWSCDDLKTLTFSRLKCLTVNIEDNKDQESLEAFLKNHLSSLEELDIAVKEEFTQSLFEVIKKLSPSLKKLHLRAKAFTHDSHIQGREEEIDWKFLKGMNHLKNFKIGQTSKSNTRENMSIDE